MNKQDSQKVRTLTGIVVSDKMHKTVVVLVVRKIKHPLYGKYVKHSTKIHVHDENNQAKLHDEVTIMESRPISRTKHWRLHSVVSRNSGELNQLTQAALVESRGGI